MMASLLKHRVRHAGLVLGVLLCACGSEPQQQPEPPSGVLQPSEPAPPSPDPQRPPRPPLPPPPPPRLDIRAALPAPDGVPGDFDGDGNVDLLADSDDGLLLSRGRGDGTFFPVEFQSTPQRWSISAVGDLDRDGDLDVLSLHVAPGPFQPLQRALMNDGTGRFTEGQVMDLKLESLLPYAPVSATLADVDRDGALDVLTVHRYWERTRTHARLTLWHTAGTGTFSRRSELAANMAAFEMAAGDLNGDGFPEVLVAHDNPSLLEVINIQGVPGPLASRKQLNVREWGCTLKGMALGDFDRDGDTDVALSCDGVEVLLNDGQGNLTRAARYASRGTTGTLLAVDVDKDGRLDLVLDDYAQGPSLLRGQGDGSFSYRAGWATRVRSFSQYNDPYSTGLFVTDINRDGHLDLLSRVVLAPRTYGVLLPGDGRGGFIGPEARLHETGLPAYAFGDINRDGAEDIVSQRALFLSGLGGTFQQTAWPFDLGPLIRMVDLDEDGASDVIAQNELWLSDGRTLGRRSAVAGALGSLFTGKHDVDQDGTLDLVFRDTFARGLGQGRFMDAMPLPSTPGLYLKGPFVFADFDGDGARDVHAGSIELNVCTPEVGCQRQPQGAGVCLWNSAQRRYEYASGGAPLTVLAAADLTGDGVVDLLGAGQLARGLGNGRFEAPEPLPELSLVEQARLGLRDDLLLGDVDADGHTDVLRFREPDWIDLLRGLENGELAPALTFFAPGFRPDSRLADVDGDLLPELVRPALHGLSALKLTTR